EEAEIGDRLEGVEVAEDRPEYGVHQMEARADEIRAIAPILLELPELGGNVAALLCERRIVPCCVEAPDIIEDGRAELDPGAVTGALESVLGMKAGSHRVVEIFANDGALEEHVVADDKERHFAQGRDGAEPLGLVGEVDIDPLMRDALL